MALTEDDLYRASTQYRLWSYTPESLASLRASTNKAAAARVVAAIQKRREARAQNPSDSGASTPNASHSANGTSTPNGTGTSTAPISTLTPKEELQILTHYAKQLIFWSTSLFHYPHSVTATAVVYFKRFYLSNSPMTYHPKTIFPTCLFLATKTENHHPDLNYFVETLKRSASRLKPSREEILAPEYLLVQGLRFTLEVRHPRRGCDGVWMELDAVAQGRGVNNIAGKSGKELQKEMAQLSAPKNSKGIDTSSGSARAGTAHAQAKETLSSAALLTDAYFLYTPSQIAFAALLLADEPLALFYLRLKVGDLESAKGTRVMGAIRGCADLMKDFVEGKGLGLADKGELVRVDKKLYECLNPEKRDLVGQDARAKAGLDKTKLKENVEAKMEESEGGDGVSEGIAGKKKRKIEDDDVFGPELKKHESSMKKVKGDGG